MTLAHVPDRIEQIAVDQLIPYANNSRTHSDDQVRQIVASILEFGFTNPVLVDGAGGIIAGHGRVLAARAIGLDAVPCIRLEHLSEAQRRAYVIADNKLAELSGWDEELLAAEVRALEGSEFDLSLLGFEDAELRGFLEDETTKKKKKEKSTAPPVQAHAVTKAGEVWICGRHRILCGDSSRPEHVASVLAGERVDLICTDPPYCSGGFQEAAKANKKGSVGVRDIGKAVANDSLSTRGYMALLKAAFSNLDAPYVYAFTDWRMWQTLFDVVESSGFGVRSMVVWDKGSAGLGRVWRAQHELIMWACKQVAPMAGSGSGNVIKQTRTGNVNHTTEKPVELIEHILKNTPFAERVADPFNGSGTTMIACEKLGRQYFGIELDTLYVDVSVRRWQQLTGKAATLDGDGRTFDAIAAERVPAQG